MGEDTDKHKHLDQQFGTTYAERERGDTPLVYVTLWKKTMMRQAPRSSGFVSPPTLPAPSIDPTTCIRREPPLRQRGSQVGSLSWDGARGPWSRCARHGPCAGIAVSSLCGPCREAAQEELRGGGDEQGHLTRQLLDVPVHPQDPLDTPHLIDVDPILSSVLQCPLPCPPRRPGAPLAPPPSLLRVALQRDGP
jgi:hypothetical protein